MMKKYTALLISLLLILQTIVLPVTALGSHDSRVYPEWKIAYMPNPDEIVIDGILDEAYPDTLAPMVVSQPMLAEAASGTSADVSLWYNADKLYVFADITDADIIDPPEDLQTNEPWSTESIEFLLEIPGAEYIYQWRMDAAGYPTFYAQDGVIWAYGPDDAAAYFDKWEVKQTNYGYAVEMILNLPEDYTFSAEETYGLQIQINDVTASNTRDVTNRYYLNATGDSWSNEFFANLTLTTENETLAMYQSCMLPVLSSADEIVIDGALDASYTDPIPRLRVSQPVTPDAGMGTYADVRLAYYENLLFVHAVVHDSDIVTPDASMQETEPWNTDSLELLLNHPGASTIHQWRLDVSEYPTYYTHDGSAYGYGKTDAAPYFADYCVTVSDNGTYTIEAALLLPENLVFYGDEAVGIQMQINDVRADNPTGVHNFYHLNAGGESSFDTAVYAEFIPEKRFGDIVLTYDSGTLCYLEQPESLVYDGVRDTAYDDTDTLRVEQPVWWLDGNNSTGVYADVNLAYNGSSVYVYADVHDEILCTPNPDMQANEPWNTDSLEVLLQLEGAPTVYQWRADISGYLSFYTGDESIVAYGDDAAPYFGSTGVYTKEDGTGYIVEMELLLPDGWQVEANPIGLQLQVNDLTENDTSAASVVNLNQITENHSSFTTELYTPLTPERIYPYAGTVIPYLDAETAGAIVVDGELDALYPEDVTAVRVDQYCGHFSFRRTAAYADFRLFYTDDALFVHAQVHDAERVTPDPELQQTMPWGTDSVEVLLDLSDQTGGIVPQWRVDLSGFPSYYTSDESVMAYGTEAAAPYFRAYNTVETDYGYDVEMVIDLSAYTLTPDSPIGVQLQINDVTAEITDSCTAIFNLTDTDPDYTTFSTEIYTDFVLEYHETAEENHTGDINGDGVTDNTDLALLDAYLAGEDVTVDLTYADIDGDGTAATVRDAAYLARALAGWDGYTDRIAS